MKNKSCLWKCRLYLLSFFILVVIILLAFFFMVVNHIHLLSGQQIKDLKYLYIIISVLIVAVFLILLNLFGNRIDRFLISLKESLEKVNQGDLTVRLQFDSPDNLCYLAEKFNDMIQTVEDTLDQLENNQKNLEFEINKKTQDLKETNIKLKKALSEFQETQKKAIHNEKQRSLTDIVSGFAHEINNPLSGILGYVTLLEMRTDLTPYVKNKLINIKEQALRIKEIIGDLSQLNPDISQPKLDINLVNLMEKLIKIVSSGPNCRGIVFATDFQVDELLVRGHHMALWHVFEGILTNAIEAIIEKEIREDGKIEVSIKKSEDGSMGIVCISDNGPGFENIDKAFDPFYTTKGRTKKKGIGLSIAYNIIYGHEGNILLENTNNGAKASVFIPLVKDRRDET